MKKKPNFPHYWMCNICAYTKGGVFPEGHCATVTSGTCEYCNSENVTLIPWVDFDWDDDSSTAAARILRD